MWLASFEPVESHVGQCQLVVHPGHYRHPRQQTRLSRFELRIAPGEHYGCLRIAPVEIAYGTAAFAVGLGGNAAGVHHNKIRNATLGAVCDSVCGKISLTVAVSAKLSLQPNVWNIAVARCVICDSCL